MILQLKFLLQKVILLFLNESVVLVEQSILGLVVLACSL